MQFRMGFRPLAAILALLFLSTSHGMTASSSSPSLFRDKLNKLVPYGVACGKHDKFHAPRAAPGVGGKKSKKATNYCAERNEY